MGGPIRPNEIRVVIRPVEARDYDLGPIPAEFFKKTFDAFLTALQVTDRELQPKARSSEFLISQLALNPYEFGILEKRRPHGQNSSFGDRVLPPLRRGHLPQRLPDRCETPAADKGVHPDRQGARPEISMSSPNSVDTELPVDDFFGRQVDRVGVKDDPRSQADNWFLGSAMMSFEGRLDEIDYRGAVWTGDLMLPAGTTHVECVFDKSQGEDALNPFGNKNVCITGRAIYTGDSQLPERIEVISIEERAHVNAAIDIRGSLVSDALFREGRRS